MSSALLGGLFGYRVTRLPDVVDAIAGRYYNNGLINAVTWLFALWTVLHYCFDVTFEKFLRKMSVKECTRLRMRAALWMCAFAATALTYTLATLHSRQGDAVCSSRSDAACPTCRPHSPAMSSSGTLTCSRSSADTAIPEDLALGFALIVGFYLHSVLYDILESRPIQKVVNNGALLLLIFYICCTRRHFDLYLMVISVNCFGKLLTKCVIMLVADMSTKSKISNPIACDIVLGITILILSIFYVLTSASILSGFLGFSKTRLQHLYKDLQCVLFSLMFIAAEIYNSPIYNFALHWINHVEVKEERICSGSRIDCALFIPRDDFAFNMNLIRKEIQQREDKAKGLRTPKQKGLLTQTIKCMLTMKKKMREKRLKSPAKWELDRAVLSMNAKNAIEGVNDAGDDVKLISEGLGKGVDEGIKKKCNPDTNEGSIDDIIESDNDESSTESDSNCDDSEDS